MRVLKTDDCFYVAGGDDGDGRDGSGHDGYANDSGGGWGSRGDVAATSDKNYCIAMCSRQALPTSDFGMAFARCMNSCYSPFGGNGLSFFSWNSGDSGGR